MNLGYLGVEIELWYMVIVDYDSRKTWKYSNNDKWFQRWWWFCNGASGLRGGDIVGQDADDVAKY